MKYKRLIKKWASLRHSDPKFAAIALRMYESETEPNKKKMLEEFQLYIIAVRDGKIEASIPKIPIKVFKNGT